MTVRRTAVIVPFLITIVACLACEDVIQVDLDSSEPRLVIEGLVSQELSPHVQVKISMTGDYYRPNDFPPVSGADVTVWYDSSDTFELTETEPGLYVTDEFFPRNFTKYYLSVQIGEMEYTASSTMPGRLPWPNTFTQFESADLFEEEGYTVYCHFLDDPLVDNYYRLRIQRNGEPMDTLLLHEDRWSNGKEVEFFMTGFELGDTLVLHLAGIEKGLFEYFETMEAIAITEDKMESAWVPDNPVTNIEGGALGYFGAFSDLRLWVIVR